MLTAFSNPVRQNDPFAVLLFRVDGSTAGDIAADLCGAILLYFCNAVRDDMSSVKGQLSRVVHTVQIFMNRGIAHTDSHGNLGDGRCVTVIGVIAIYKMYDSFLGFFTEVSHGGLSPIVNKY